MDEPKKASAPKRTRNLDRIIRFVGYLLILLPAALGFLYVRAFGVSVVQRDAWSMVPLFDKWSAGTLQISDLFVQHFEHRSAFPEVAMLLLGIATKYDNVAEMYVIQACLLVTLIVLLLAFRANIKSSWGLFLFVPISLLIFSFRQEANMLFGYQINFAFVVTFGVLTLFLLYVVGHRSFKKSAFVAALVSATVASYSIVGGLLVWPAGLLQLFIVPLEKPKKRFFAVLWGLVGLSVWVAYLNGWHSDQDKSSFIDWRGSPGTKAGDWSAPSDTGPDPSVDLSVFDVVFDVLEHPLAGLDFFLNLLASSLLWPQQRNFEGFLFGEHLGSVAGLLLVCLVLVGLFLVYKDGRLGRYSFWISLVFYSFLILAAIVAKSFPEGIDEALAPRYTSFSVLAVVSIYGLLATTALGRGLSIRRPNIGTILLVFLSGAVILSAATSSYPNGINAGRQNREKTEEAAFVLATYESQPDEVLGETPGLSLGEGAKVTRERAPVLQRLGYNVFSEAQAQQILPPPLSALSPVGSSTSSGIVTLSTDTDTLLTDADSDARADQQNRSVVVPQEASFIKLDGWAVDADNESTAGGVYIDVDGRLFPAFYGARVKQKMARSLGGPEYRYSGFERAIPVSEIGAGSHELSIVILTHDRKGYYRPGQKVALEIEG